MRGQHQPFALKLSGAVLITLFLLTTWLVQPAIGVTPPTQDPRPTLAPPQPPAGPGGDTDGDGGLPGESCAGLRGTVINWGYRNEPGITVRLSDGGWETTQVTSSDGRYQFGPLGQGIAFLAADLAPGQAETLNPIADNVAIRLRCDFDVIANLGLSSSASRPHLPATIRMGVSQDAVLPGGTATFFLTLKNGMPNSISHVFVTDYLPEGLSVIDVTTTKGTVEVLDGRMIVVDVGEMTQGGKETIQIKVEADPTLASGTRLHNTATLLYAESAADQAWANLTVAGAKGKAAVRPTALPSASLDQVTPKAAATPSADQSASPTDELLPVTGERTTVALPAVLSIGLVIVLIGANRLRGRFTAR